METRNISELNERAKLFTGVSDGKATSTTSITTTTTSIMYPNLDPRTQNVLNRKIKMLTYDKTTPRSTTTLQEGHLIVPLFSPTEVSGGIPTTKKFVVKLGSSGYALKFHLPQGAESTMYMTFSKEDSNYVDGYYDYITSVPAAFIDALKAWCESSRNSTIPRTFSETTTIRKRRLSFSYMGRLTTDPNKSGKFYVDITYQSSIISTPNEETPTGSETSFTKIR